MTHVFLAALGAAFGEALHGVRLCTALQEAGDEVIFLGPAGLGPLLAGLPLRFGRIDAALPHLHRAVRDLLRESRADTLVLVDLAGVAEASVALGFDLGALLDPGLPGVQVLALDCWELSRAGGVRDLGPEDHPIGPPHLREAVAKLSRLVPVPIAHLDAPGAYNALPGLSPPTPAARDAVRAELGLAPGQRLVLLTSARWQHPENQDQPDRQRLAAAVPALLFRTLSALPPEVQVLHVGPLPFASGPAALGGRYRHADQVPPATFTQLLGAADLVVSVNAVATTLGTALCAGVPVLLLQSTLSGATPAQVEDGARAAGFALGPLAREALPGLLPLFPLRACPLSLHRFLAPVVRDNLLYEAVAVAELLDEGAVLSAAHALLFDDGAAARARDRQAAYVRAVRQLPDGVTRLRALLSA